MGIGSEVRQTIDFQGDMSAARRSKPIPLQGGTRVSAEICWPATGTPIGVIGVEVTDDPTATTGFVYPVTISAGNQPAGTAGGVLLRNLEVSEDYIIFTYTPTSGGTGAAFCDKDGNDLPHLVVKE